MVSSGYESDATVQHNAVTWQHYALVATVSMALWLLLTGSFDQQEIITGAVVSVLVTALFGARFTIFTGFIFRLRVNDSIKCGNLIPHHKKTRARASRE